MALANRLWLYLGGIDPGLEELILSASSSFDNPASRSIGSHNLIIAGFVSVNCFFINNICSSHKRTYTKN